jgi:hypothetical protein
MIETTKYTTLNVVKAVTLQTFFPRLTVLLNAVLMGYR